METIKILTFVCITQFVCIARLIIIFLASRKENKELKEGTYLIRNVEIVVNHRTIKVNYCIPYDKRCQSKQDQAIMIRDQLEAFDYGCPNFNEDSARWSLRNLHIRNLNIIPV